MRFWFFIFSFLTFAQLYSQVDGSYKVANDRMLWHDQVDRQQRRILNDSGKVILSTDSIINRYLSLSLIQELDRLQRKIELDTAMNTNHKKKYLRGLEIMLKSFYENFARTDFPPSLSLDLIPAFSLCMEYDFRNESIKPVIQANSYGVGKILVGCFVFPTENPGIKDAQIELVRKYCQLHPDQILPQLRLNPNLYFADSLLQIAAYRDLSRFYDYAQANNDLTNRMRKHPDSLVQLISQLAQNKSGRLYFPFFDQLLRKKITIAEIDSVKNNEKAYFKLMVKTRTEYVERMLPPTNDTAREMQALTQMMTRKARQYFINEINALHAEENENIRFRILDSLTAQELYYLAVLSEDQIYTSSFVKGIYPRIFRTTNCGDSLLLRVKVDYFRKFIKMCAAYNTLNDFLQTMDRENAGLVMKAFVIGLEKTVGSEDAVDVADSYSSIVDKNPVLAAFIRDEVKWNLKRNKEQGNERGKVIYKILDVLFNSADTSKHVDVAAELGIPPVYTVENKSLQDSNGVVAMQAFFYGDEDKDGQNSYASFMARYRANKYWKIQENAEWVTITSTKPPCIMIFANKPLMGEDDPEEKAIDHLTDTLEMLKIKPSVYIHRGHSFHVPSTMKRILPTARVVILGSCGGYNNINEVLSISDDAHIVSSKQTGTMHVNEPLLQSINNLLMAGKNIEWVPLWSDLQKKFKDPASKEKFDDYVPPFKNLGALFIKAYKLQMNKMPTNP